jgi:hypothetical protein
MASFDDFAPLEDIPQDENLEGHGNVDHTIPTYLEVEGNGPRHAPVVQEGAVAPQHPAQYPAPLPVQEQAQEPVPDQTKNRNERVERRFNKLVSTLKEKDESLATAQETNELLRQQIRLLEAGQPLNRAATQVRAPAPSNIGGTIQDDHLGLGGSDGARDEVDIGQVVSRAIQPLVERIDSIETRGRQTQESDQLNDQIALGHQEALREFPELQKAEHPLTQMAGKIYASDPSLQKDPRGSYKATLMAKGLLEDVAEEEAAGTVQKQNAALINQSVSEGTPVRRGGGQSFSDSLRRAAHRCDDNDWAKLRQAGRDAQKRQA